MDKARYNWPPRKDSLNEDWVEVVFREFNFSSRSGASDDEVVDYDRVFSFGFRDINLVVSSGNEGDKNSKFDQNGNRPRQNQHDSSKYIAKYTLTLTGDSMARVEETVRFALELHIRKIPFKLVNIEKIIKALKGEDYIGIVPEDVSPKYAQHYFKKAHNVLHVLNPWLFSENNSEIVEAIDSHGELSYGDSSS